ncbi:MAG TPA: hypothetical protein PLQ71_10510 [Nitrospira sp.]|nr:hypothetical protein [Nitrospira sp.]
MRERIDGVDFAVDEHIWGHRLYDEQLPHLAVMEFLGVLASNRDAPLVERAGEKVRYRPQRQIRLRSLLFNNPYVQTVRDRPISDSDKWDQWEALFLADATGHGDKDIAYLRETFLSFDDFAKAVELLRSSAFEARSNKRWSSKFIFPFGPDALYEDLRIDASGASNDRRFFARTGEILYLMLCRATNGPELGKRLVERLFVSSAPLNRLARAMQGDAQSAQDPRDVGYLPHGSHPRFDRLCDDWLAILSRDMPVYDALEHLIASAGVNLLLYFLESAKTESGDTEPVEMVCEIVSRERSKVRALSGDSFQANQALSSRAVRASVDKFLLAPEWEAALNSSDPSGQCMAALRDQFQWPPSESDDEHDYSQMTGADMASLLAEKALSRHEQHFGKIHAAWSRSIGLSSRRLARRTRYAPNDRLLKSLVIAMVDERMQFDDFLHEAKRRYGLVIGDAEGSHLIRDGKIDQEALSDNRDNLESRLMSLGLVRRLSDSCSFVENPFASRGES